MPKLTIMQPEGEHKTVELTEDQAVIIGRLPDCAVQIDDPLCSRRHCQITKLAAVWELVDLKSRNGTKVNGVARTRHVLSDGDIIEIGSVRITFRDRAGEEEEVVLEDFGAPESVAEGEECYLLFADGDRKGEKIVLTGDRTTFGRKESNTVVLKDPMVSSYHCEVTREAGGHVLRDLGSTNGSMVNGEPVSETALNHGARIRLGRTRFVFADPAVADFEQALAAEEEAESEWGLMRAQVDMAAVRRKARASLIWLLAAVVILGGVAAFFALNPEQAKELLNLEEPLVVVDVAGNLIPDFSFERGEVDWAVAEGAAGGARVTAGPAKQGTSAIEVSGTGEIGVPTLVWSADKESVSAGRTYELSAWVRTSSPEAAAVAVRWLVSGARESLLFSITPWAGTGEWNQVQTVVSPPRDATECVPVLVLAGEGTARFDDVVFRETKEQPRRSVSVESNGFTLTVGEDGALCVERSGTFLLWNGGFVALLDDDRPVYHRLFFRADRVDGGQSGVTVTGWLRLPGGAKMPASVAVTPGEDRVAIKLDAKGSPPSGVKAAGLAFEVAPAYLSQFATLTGPKGARAIHSETDEPEVEKVILGGPGSRLSLVAATPMRLKMFSGAGLRLAFLSSPGSGDFELVTDFSGERGEAQRVLSEARRARSVGKYGEAMRLYDRVINVFPFDDRSREAAVKERADILAEGKKRFEEISGIYASAKDFYDEGDLEKALAGAKDLLADYEGHEVSEKAQDLVDEIEGILTKVRRERHEAEAARLLKRAKDFESRRQTSLANACYREIVERFPGTEAEKQAQVKIGPAVPKDEGRDEPVKDEGRDEPVKDEGSDKGK